MSDQLWSWILTICGLAGFWLAGRKIWWAWYVNIANQVLWFVYSWTTGQWGFLIGAFAYSFVFIKNAIAWTKEHQLEKAAAASRPPTPYMWKGTPVTAQEYSDLHWAQALNATLRRERQTIQDAQIPDRKINRCHYKKVYDGFGASSWICDIHNSEPAWLVDIEDSLLPCEHVMEQP